MGSGHVRQHLVDGAALVGRRHVGEALGQIGHAQAFGIERVARCGDPPLVQHHQLLGDLGDRCAHLGLLALEVAAAHATEPGRLPADVGADEVDLLGGQVEPVGSPEFQLEVVALVIAEGPAHEPCVAGDAVMVMNDEVADAEIFERRRDAGATSSCAMDAAATGELCFGQHRNPGCGRDETLFERCDHHVTAWHRGEA